MSAQVARRGNGQARTSQGVQAVPAYNPVQVPPQPKPVTLIEDTLIRLDGELSEIEKMLDSLHEHNVKVRGEPPTPEIGEAGIIGGRLPDPVCQSSQLWNRLERLSAARSRLAAEVAIAITI